METIDYINIIKETQRLVVRPTKEEDFITIKEGLKGQGQRKNKYDDDEIELAEQYTQVFCKNSVNSFIQRAKDDKAYLFRVFRKENGIYVGGVIIKTIQRKSFQWAEIGYWLLNQHWGNGYAGEMIKAAIDIAFYKLNFHRVEAHINLDNLASQRAAERAGMGFECIRKRFIYEDGLWTDNMVYVINNTELSI